MLIAGFPAGPWGTNCYVVATGPGTECVVIDPGKDAAEGVAQVVREHQLKPVAVLVTHGHVDHMWCVAPVAGTYDATAWIHPDDRHLLAEPDGRHVARRRPRCCSAASTSSPSPTASRSSPTPQTLELAGLEFVVDHTPGHTEGSVTFRTPYDEQDIAEVMFSGDLLFAGSIGRTDLPGGDHPTMLRSLRDKVLTLRRRHRRAARPRRADQHRPRARHQPVPARPDRRRTGHQPGHPRTLTMARPTPLSGFPELLPAQRFVEQQVLDTPARDLRAARVRQRRDPRRRAARPAAAQGRDLDKEVYVLRRLHAEDGDGDAGARACTST